MPNSISANYSETNGERRVVDNASTFIVGDGSNLKVGKVENTAAAKTYISGSGLNNVLNKYGRAIKDFDEYELKGIYLNKDKIEQNILKIVINNEPLNKSQMENLKRVVEHATEDGIKVEAVILK